ncbi:hypothetical protein RRG08_062164 [Elysia crispata]|uniref:Metallo-beta-lactamase domain-containing protein n=1 Tax=Elysia crispata TaxID=231223 RepID=A0AAE0YC74_9GAST|nr:hypothetical protein RRG08_062164 [Elysia crispata]
MNVQPEAVLTTHKHWDHSGGNRQMRSTFPGLKVYGGTLDHVPDCTHTVDDGQELRFGQLKFTAMWTPRPYSRATPCGDCTAQTLDVRTVSSLETCLCWRAAARLLKGPVRQLNASLNKMKDLPDDTMVWPGHELALENLELAVFIEPENIKALLKLVWAFNRRGS